MGRHVLSFTNVTVGHDRTNLAITRGSFIKDGMTCLYWMNPTLGQNHVFEEECRRSPINVDYSFLNYIIVEKILDTR